MTASLRPSHDRSGPFRRIPGVDASTAEAVFQAAMSLLTPDDQTQRRAFETLMPYLYVLRNKGCSWPQLTKLLTDSGFVLQPSTVRSYYSEMLATRQDLCQARMNEQILLLAELRKETKGIDVAAIGGRVAAIMGQQKVHVSAKLDSLFGKVPALAEPSVTAPTTPSASASVVVPVVKSPAPAQVRVASPPVSAAPKQAENKKTGLRPVSPGPVSGADSVVDQVPAVTKIEAAPPLSPVLSGRWRCSALLAGVELLKKRPGVSDDMYLPGDLEHPGVAGVMLSLDQRLSSVALEFVNLDDGEIRLETSDEKRWRLLWRAPIPVTQTSTAASFTTMDNSLFKKRD